MYFYHHLSLIFKEKFYTQFAVSCILIYSIRFLDFTVIAYILTNVTNNAASIGALVFIKFIPMIFSGVLSGWLVDKFSRLIVIKLVILSYSIYLLLWAIYIAFYSPNIELIFIFTFFSGILMSVDISSRISYLSSLVKRRIIKSGIAANVIYINLAWFIGPNIGMFILEISGFTLLYISLSIINIFGLIILIKIPKLKIMSNKIKTYSGFKAGFSFAKTKPIILVTLIIISVGNFFAFTFESMSPYFAKFIYDASPLEFSFMVSCQGLGALIGSIFLLPMIVKVSRPALVFLIATIFLCLGSIVFTYIPSFIFACIVLIALGTGTTFFMNMHSRILITQTPNPLRGRVNGLQQLGISLFPIGSLITGFIGDSLGVSQSMRIMSILGILCLIITFIIYKDLKNTME